MLLLQIDTTDAGYKIGYEIGQWLPVIVLMAVFIWLSVAAYRRNKKE